MDRVWQKYRQFSLSEADVKARTYLRKMFEDSVMLQLPLEILKEISSYLNYPSMCRLLMVSRGWRKVWEEPLLWTQVKFTPKHVNDLEAILNTKRFSAMRRLRLKKLTNESLQVLRNHPSIRCLEIHFLSNKNLDKDDFAEVLSRCEALKLHGDEYTINQVKYVNK